MTENQKLRKELQAAIVLFGHKCHDDCTKLTWLERAEQALALPTAAPAVPQGEAWGYVDHRGCAIKFKNARHRSELANAIECGGLEYLYTSPAEKLGNDIESALESLVERCNNDAGMSNEDAVIHAEAVLERVYNSRSATPAPAPAQEPAGEAVVAALGDIIAMWDQHVPSEYVTPLHMQAKRALEGQQPVSPDMHGWCAYVGGMVAHWIRSEPDAFIEIGEERFEAAIAGIIERRLWAMPKNNKPTAAPKPAQESGLTDEAVNDAAKVLAERFDYPWEHMPEEGRKNMRVQARAVVEAAIRAKGGKL